MSGSEIVRALTPVVEELERLDVVYYVGGSVASSVYGVARSTSTSMSSRSFGSSMWHPSRKPLGDPRAANGLAVQIVDQHQIQRDVVDLDDRERAIGSGE